MGEKLSNDTIKEMFKNIKEKLDEIHEQTKRTNGRVTSLEDSRSKMKGALIVLNLVVVPLLLYLIYIHISK